MTRLSRYSVRIVPLFATAATLTGCGGKPTPQVPVTVMEETKPKREAPHPAAPPPVRRSGDDAFPASEVPASASVSRIFEAAVDALRSKYATPATYKTAPRRERIVAARNAVAAFQSLFLASLKQARSEHAELKVAEDALATVLSSERYPIEFSDAVLFGASEVLDAVLTNEKTESFADALAPIASFCASSEQAYRATFDGASVVWGAYGGAEGWASHPLTERLKKHVLEGGAGRAVSRGVTVHATNDGPARVAFEGAVDQFGPFAGNGLAEPGEVVAASVTVRGRDLDSRLFSESILVTAVPDCAVALDKEIVLPEIARAKSSPVALPRVLFTNRCGRKETLHFELVSSSYARSVPITVDVDLHQTNFAIDPPTIDADVPGSSVKGNPKLGIVPGQPIEVRLSGTGSAELSWSVRKAVPAIKSDGGAFAIAHEDPFRLTGSGGRLSGTNDLDVEPNRKKSFEAAWKARSKSTPLTLDPAATWVAVAVVGVDRQRGAETSVAEAPVNAPVVAAAAPQSSGAEDGRKRGRKHQSQIVSLDAAVSGSGAASRFYDEYAPVAKGQGSEIAAIYTDVIAPARQAMREVLVTRPFIDGDPESLGALVVELVGKRALRDDVLSKVLSVADKGRAEKNASAHRLVRNLLVLKAVVGAAGELSLADALPKLAIESADTESLLEALPFALAREAVIARYKVERVAAGLDAFVEACMASDGSDTGPQPVELHRYLRLPVSIEEAADE